MAKKKEENPEGKAVRRAYDGPDLEHDKMIGNMEARNREDADRASTAGESRQAIGEFLKETGMNSKAYSWLRQILKTKSQAKQMDIIRSLEAGLPMVKAHCAGQGDMLDADAGDDAPDSED